MASRSLQSFRRTITVSWPKVGDAQAKAHLISVAKAGHAKIMTEQAARGGAPTWEAYANTPGRPIESVVLPGPIVYRYQYLREVIQFALDELRKASPVVSGDYVRSHTIYINGTAGVFDIDQLNKPLRSGHEIFISNPVPYARRIEVGKTKDGRAFVIQVQPKIYENVTKLVQAKYRNLAKITFGYATLPDAYIVTGGMQQRTPRYLTGDLRKVTQTHWMGTNAAGVEQGWVTFRAGEAKSRIRRQKTNVAVRAPAIFIDLLT